MKRLLILPAAFLTVSFASFAQTETTSETIVDASDGSPLIGASVSVVGYTSIGTPMKFTHTASTVFWSLDNFFTLRIKFLKRIIADTVFFRNFGNKYKTLGLEKGKVHAYEFIS